MKVKVPALVPRAEALSKIKIPSVNVVPPVNVFAAPVKVSVAAASMAMLSFCPATVPSPKAPLMMVVPVPRMLRFWAVVLLFVKPAIVNVAPLSKLFAIETSFGPTAMTIAVFKVMLLLPEKLAVALVAMVNAVLVVNAL